tara:strand:- start:1423 stop:1686 length:264 start_codon:yes stop_codon:yes gene_type:complete
LALAELLQYLVGLGALVELISIQISHRDALLLARLCRAFSFSEDPCEFELILVRVNVPFSWSIQLSSLLISQLSFLSKLSGNSNVPV